MSPAAAPESKAASLDFRKALLETFAIDKKAACGLWEWGSLWRDCGFGNAAGRAASK
jgi:hypothetical protein